MLHLLTLEWVAEQTRRLLERLSMDLRREGREPEAITSDFILRKVHGLLLREHETQRKRLNRATKRDREKLENELRLTKRRAGELEADLARIQAAQEAIDEAQRVIKPRGLTTIGPSLQPLSRNDEP